MAACDGYSCSALMGNWFEHRNTLKQASQLRPEEKLLR